MLCKKSRLMQIPPYNMSRVRPHPGKGYVID